MIVEVLNGLVEFFGTIVVTLLVLATMFGLSIKMCDAWRRIENARENRARKLRYPILIDAERIVNDYLKKDKQES